MKTKKFQFVYVERVPVGHTIEEVPKEMFFDYVGPLDGALAEFRRLKGYKVRLIGVRELIHQ